jgi:hypothetical protein
VCIVTSLQYALFGIIHSGGALIAAGKGLAHHSERRGRARLLHHMGEFVGEEAAALHRSRHILARRKCNIAPEREGACIDALRRRTRSRIVVNAYPRKVIPEARLEIGPQIGREGRATV